MKLDYLNITEEQIEEFIERIEWFKVPNHLLISETAFKFVDDFLELENAIRFSLINRFNYEDGFFISAFIDGIKKGYLLNWKNGFAIYTLSSIGHLTLIKYIENNGVDMKLYANDCFSIAAQSGKIDLVKFFIDKGADIRVNDDFALRYCCHTGQRSIVEILLKLGADPNTDRGYPVKSAITYNFPDTLEILIKYGADVITDGESLIQEAKKNKKTEIVEILLKAGVNSKHLDKFTLTNKIKNKIKEWFKKIKNQSKKTKYWLKKIGGKIF